MIKQLKKDNQILCTSRNYREVTQLAKLRKMKLILIGKHGGQSKIDKLNASLSRTAAMTRRIQKFKPDLTISFCSPEAARISFGLGVRHIAFCDSPHAEAVMRLSVPFIQKLLIPWIIPKKEFTKYGIEAKDIIPYKAIDAAIIIKSDSSEKTRHFKKDVKRNILIRIEEEQAAYAQRKQKQILPIIKEIATKFPNDNVLVLPRYNSQIGMLRQAFGDRIKILERVVLGKTLLQNTDVFVGSGGTMTAEAALLGIPTISYNAIPNLVQDYLVRKKLVTLESNPKRIATIVEKMLYFDNKRLRENAKKTLASMEDPLKKLVQVIKARDR
jgi:predicted glycosyltransferase